MQGKGKAPKWASPERQNQLILLFERSGGFCVFGHNPCRVASHHYENFVDDLVKDWQADDRAEARAIWQAEQKAIHSLWEVGKAKGEFSAVARAIWHDRQPEYYLIGIGISGLAFKPFAKVRLASSFMHLHVDVGEAMRKVGKVRKRKAIRYGKPLPQNVQSKIDEKCNMAVRAFLNHKAPR